jgi:hypothetical protein
LALAKLLDESIGKVLRRHRLTISVCSIKIRDHSEVLALHYPSRWFVARKGRILARRPHCCSYFCVGQSEVLGNSDSELSSREPSRKKLLQVEIIDPPNMVEI